MFIISNEPISENRLKTLRKNGVHLMKWVARIFSGGSSQEFLFYAETKDEAELKIKSIFPGLAYNLKEENQNKGVE